MAELLPRDVMVLTQAELVAWERRYWEEATPIGFIFAFGSLMGLVVGMVIVYQILFSDIASHLREYATLKAMGYSNWYLGRAVLSAALILAVLGFVPGFAVSFFLYDAVGKGTFLPLDMGVERALERVRDDLRHVRARRGCSRCASSATPTRRTCSDEGRGGGSDPIELRGIGYSLRHRRAGAAGAARRGALRRAGRDRAADRPLRQRQDDAADPDRRPARGADGQRGGAGAAMAGASERQRVALRRRIGFIFQSHNLLGFLSARQNVAMALELDGATREAERLERAGAMLEAVGVGDRADAPPAKLSGGQRQRVAVARALAGRPGPDPGRRADGGARQAERRRGGAPAARPGEAAGVPILMVTHDPRILDIADRIVAMEDGRVAAAEACGDGGGVTATATRIVARPARRAQAVSRFRAANRACRAGRRGSGFAAADPVRHHERRARHDQFARARLPARASALRETPQAVYRLPDSPDHLRRGARPLARDVGAGFVQFRDGLPGVTDDHRQRA